MTIFLFQYNFGFDTTKTDVFSPRGEGDIRIVQNDLTALNCMQLLTKFCEGLGIIKGKLVQYVKDRCDF